MKKRINIIKTEILNDQLVLKATEITEQLSPRGQMLVDSDHFAFIYILENDVDYTYIALPEEIWPTLKKSNENGWKVYLESESSRIELIQFNEELTYLVDNIKGNSNYGDEMVGKVEEAFQ